MDLYTKTSYQLSRVLTENYSTSFSKSASLFKGAIRNDIYAIYALVRIADEIVDTYAADDAGVQLTKLEADTYDALKSAYSTNPIIHAFVTTATQNDITKELIKPFFHSMRMDLSKRSYSPDEYHEYIYGSAEVIGLMCLKVFTKNKQSSANLEKGAQALGSAYQKINFLRDFADDYTQKGRVYFPGVTFENFNDNDKQTIIQDIHRDLKSAEKILPLLPKSSRTAVLLSLSLYKELLKQLEAASVSVIKQKRLSVSPQKKALLFAATLGKQGFQS